MSAKAAVVVQVVLSVDVGDAWSRDCTLSQVYDQAKALAARRVGKLVDSDGSVRVSEVHVHRVVVSDPEEA